MPAVPKQPLLGTGNAALVIGSTRLETSERLRGGPPDLGRGVGRGTAAWTADCEARAARYRRVGVPVCSRPYQFKTDRTRGLGSAWCV